MKRQLRRSPVPEWVLVPQQKVMEVTSPLAEPIDEMWQWRKPKELLSIQIHRLGEKRFGNVIHLTVKKFDMLEVAKNRYEALFNSMEPTYAEKRQIVQKLAGDQNIIAMEVFPKQRSVVDQANLYHIWTAEKAKFPFGVKETTELPEGKEWTHEQVDDLDIEYMVRTARTEHGKIAYLYLKRTDGKELCWREKQFLKNELQGEELSAIEIISKHGIDKPTCLMFLPLDYSLDFGLHIM